MYLESDERLAAVRPSGRQLMQQEMGFYGFIHYGMNTYTGREWGDGNEPEEWFCPEVVDTDQWAKVAAAAGMKGLILTCKHHDGFCLWPSAYTEHSVKNAPYQNGRGDLVRQTAESCRKYGLRFGVYLSPWDRHEKTYGSGKTYDDFYVNQLTELLTGYGELFCVWMDGACGEGPDGRVQTYDWARYYETVRRLQPWACISVCGPDIRWCGNEAGDTRESEWNVVPARLADAAATAARSQQADNEGFRQKPISRQDRDLGSRGRLAQEEALVWYPAEVDMSVRPGWFYHEAEDGQVCTLDRLKDVYFRSVGGNAMLLLNLPPDREGQLGKPDNRVLTEFGCFLRETFRDNLAKAARLYADSADPEHMPDLLTREYGYYGTEHGVTEARITLEWREPQTVGYIVLQEYLPLGQRVERFEIRACDVDGREAADRQQEESPEMAGEQQQEESPEMAGEQQQGNSPEMAGEQQQEESPEMAGEQQQENSPEMAGEQQQGNSPEMAAGLLQAGGSKEAVGQQQEAGPEVTIAQGTVIGQKRIVSLETPVCTRKITRVICDARVSIALRFLGIYGPEKKSLQ